MTTAHKHQDPMWMELETMETRLGQLEALLLNTHGTSLESFSNWNDHIREAYLAHCAEFTSALRDQARGLMERARGGLSSDGGIRPKSS